MKQFRFNQQNAQESEEARPMFQQGGCGKLYAETVQRTNQKRGFQLGRPYEQSGENSENVLSTSCQRLVNVLSTSCQRLVRSQTSIKTIKCVFQCPRIVKNVKTIENDHGFQTYEQF